MSEWLMAALGRAAETPSEMHRPISRYQGSIARICPGDDNRHESSQNMGLEGSYVKLRRAREHLTALAASVDAFLEANPYHVAVERPTEQLVVLRAHNPPRLPIQDWAPIIGDCVHNLRCALDYVAWELAGGDAGDTETLFPIFETSSGWKRGASRRLKRMSPDARTLIELVQPYHSENPRLSPLNAVRILDDADKHKLLTVTAVAMNRLQIGCQHPIGHDLVRTTVVRDPVLTDGAVLATLVFAVAHPNMLVEAKLTPFVAFGERIGLGRDTAVVESLRAVADEITLAVDTFKERFFPN